MAVPAPEGDGPPRAAWERRSREALALLLNGDPGAGLPLYEQCFRSGFSTAITTGFHLEVLERAGRDDMAHALRTLALERGANIARRGASLEGAVVEPMTEYETLFRNGFINSHMATDYMLRLSRAGEADRVKQLMDPARLLRVVKIESVAPESVAELMLRHETKAQFLEAEHSVRSMSRIDDIQLLEEPAGALLTALDAEGRRYLADWAGSDHPFAPYVPDEVRIKYWTLISRGEGFNTPHIHHRGWATGVYYPAAVEPEGAGGELCVGRPPRIAGDLPGWPEARIRPEAGMLVLMPSFYTHWTTPLGRPGLRISVAFDMIRERGTG